MNSHLKKTKIADILLQLTKVLVEVDPLTTVRELAGELDISTGTSSVHLNRTGESKVLKNNKNMSL